MRFSRRQKGGEITWTEKCFVERLVKKIGTEMDILIAL